MSTDSGYRILSVILIESQFKRLPSIPKPSSNPATVLDVKFNHVTGPSDELNVTVDAEFSMREKSATTPAIHVRVSMLGKFEVIGTPELPLDKFVEVNAPAIIFPFIREHISSLTLKSGVGQILLPPLNFTRKEAAGRKEKV